MPRTTSPPLAAAISTVRIAQWIDRPRKLFNVSAIQTPAMEITVEEATMYPKVINTETAAPIEGPNALPVKVTNDPAEGVKRENCAMVFVRNRITSIAVRMLKGAATPAPFTMTAKPKKKLIAGAILARGDATMGLAESAFRRSRVSLPPCWLDA